MYIGAFAQFLIVVLRVSIGWIFIYAGYTKIASDSWTALPYIQNAQSAKPLFEWLSDPSRIAVINTLNEWGLLLIGISLVLGLWVRFSGILGAILMVLYWLPILQFPLVGEHSYIVDDHIMYALVLIFLSAIRAGNHWGLDNRITVSVRT